MDPHTFGVRCPLESELLVLRSLEVEAHNLALWPCHFMINAKAVSEKSLHTTCETCSATEKLEAVASIVLERAMWARGTVIRR